MAVGRHSAIAPRAQPTIGDFFKVNDNQNSLKAGERGGTLLEDFILRDKITHFDHERMRALRFESHKHCKAIAATGAGIDVLVAS